MTTRRLLKRAAAAPASLLSSSRGFFRVTWSSHRRHHRNSRPRSPTHCQAPAGQQGDATRCRHPTRAAARAHTLKQSRGAVYWTQQEGMLACLVDPTGRHAGMLQRLRRQAGLGYV